MTDDRPQDEAQLETLSAPPYVDPRDSDVGDRGSVIVRATAAEFAVGTVIDGKYVVEGEVGEGGIGFVVKARHLQLEQPVAIKYVKAPARLSPDVVERFVREARLAAQIKSDHAVKVHDVDMLQTGVPYMVMEYLEGRDLRQLLDSGPLEIGHAVDYVLQASEALAEAHAAGIVHRDLKPENLFLAERPGGFSIVKILDFGISKAGGRRVQSGIRHSKRGPAALDKRSARVEHPRKHGTRDNESFGTPAFMSPEQIESSACVDARADIWSLGVLLFELVTGQLPFESEDLTQLSISILTRPPLPLRILRPDAPPELEAILLRCLQKEKEKRYRNVGELAQELIRVAPQDAHSRVTRIARVLAEAGQSVHPATPFPASVVVQPLPENRMGVTTVGATARPAPRRGREGRSREGGNGRLLFASLGLFGSVTWGMYAFRAHPELGTQLRRTASQWHAVAAQMLARSTVQPTVETPRIEVEATSPFLAAPVALAPATIVTSGDPSRVATNTLAPVLPVVHARRARHALPAPEAPDRNAGAEEAQEERTEASEPE